jgi:Icc-related predicted phosphoesterase
MLDDILAEDLFGSILDWSGIDLSGICFYGDPHGNLQNLTEFLEKKAIHTAIVVGDFFDRLYKSDDLITLKDNIEVIQKRGVDFRYILGNHDHPSIEAADFFESEIAHLNLNGKIDELGPNRVKVGGLSGVFRGRVWYPKNDIGQEFNFMSHKSLLEVTPRNERVNGKLPLKHRSTIFPETVFKLGDAECDVLVCHEAPSSSEDGFVAIDQLAQKMRSKLVVHGHHHHRSVGTINHSRCAVKSLGLAEPWEWSHSLERDTLEIERLFSIADAKRSKLH